MGPIPGHEAQSGREVSESDAQNLQNAMLSEAVALA